MSDVFISYARSTAAQAQQVAEVLRSLGYGVWRDDEIPAHRAYAEVIEERLRSAKAVVVIWSADAVKSEWVQSEADRARGDHKLVQLRVDDAALPMPFDRLECANMTSWTGDLDAHDWKKVVASVAELVGAEPAPLDREVRPVRSTRTGGVRWFGFGLLAASLAVAVLAAGALVWRPTAGRPAPWSDQDTRDTFAFTSARIAGDAALAAYADQFTTALKSRFNPSLSDARQAPESGSGAPPKAEFIVGLEFRRNGAEVITRVTLRRGAEGPPIDVREVADHSGPSPSPSAVIHASGFVKATAAGVEAALAQAKAPSQRDAHDLVILAMAAPADRAHNAEAIGWLDQAERLSPSQPSQRQVGDSLVDALDVRVMHDWSPSTETDLARIKALDQGLLSENADDPYALQTLSDSYLLQGRPDDARVAADRLLAASPNLTTALLARGRAELALGRFPEAEDMVAKLLPVQNDYLSTPIAELAGIVRFHQRRYGEAADFLRRAVQEIGPADMRGPAFAGLRLYLAAAEVEQGHLETARSSLADFRAAAPQVVRPAAFLRWNDSVRLPLVDRARVASDLAKIGWRDG